MVTPELIQYIKDEMQKGVSVATINNNLTMQGWSISDIEDAIARAQSTIPVPEVVYGSFWARFLAFFIDGIILDVVIFIVIFSSNINSKDVTWIIQFTVTFAYFIGMESSVQQATLGKKLLGLKVTDLQGKRISVGRAAGRYFSKILSAAIFFIGFFMIGFTEKKQGLHDIIAGTLVVRK